MWLPNATLYARCRNTTGGPPYQRDDYANGALFNGMVAPWVNYTMKGAIWYQVGRRRVVCAALRRVCRRRMRVC